MPPPTTALASAAPSLVLEQGQVLAKKYVLERPAGFGGMAQLWVATNQSTAAEVCVKLLVPDPETGSHERESVERFRREALAAARLSHRAIVRVFDLLELDEHGNTVASGQSPHAYAIVMELLHGETLGDLLAKRGKLPLEEAIDLILPIVSALGHAHRASVIHRDLKPDNIFLAAEPDGHVIPKVLDFGVSKLERADALTSEGVAVGTPCFMSPEQAKGSLHVGPRSDVFAAGLLLYTMLVGRNPFEDAPTFEATVDAILRRPVPRPPDIGDALWSVIARALEKDPHARWGDGTELGIALRKATGRRSTTDSEAHIPVVVPVPELALRAESHSADHDTSVDPFPPAPAMREHAARRRRLLAFGILGAVALLGVAAVIVSAVGSGRADEREAPSVQPTAHDPPVASAAAAPSATAVTEATASSEPIDPAPPATTASVAPPVTTTGPSGPAASTAPRPTSTSRPPKPEKKQGDSHIARDPGF